MSKWVQLVAARDLEERWGALLFVAPFEETICAGDEIIVETDGKPERATVIETTFAEEGERTYKVILSLSGETEPLKRVLSKVSYKEMKYTEEDTKNGSERILENGRGISVKGRGK